MREVMMFRPTADAVRHTKAHTVLPDFQHQPPPLQPFPDTRALPLAVHKNVLA